MVLVVRKPLSLKLCPTKMRTHKLIRQVVSSLFVKHKLVDDACIENSKICLAIITQQTILNMSNNNNSTDSFLVVAVFFRDRGSVRKEAETLSLLHT